MEKEPCVLFFTPLWDSNAFPIFHGVYSRRLDAEAELARKKASLSWMTFPVKASLKTFQELDVSWDDFAPYLKALETIHSAPLTQRLSAVCEFRREHDKLHYKFLEVGRGSVP